ncbi:hypothetical protein BDQ17DRAFT_1435741 [Cyathus striatus]|nr:hypothetical protein BDQ17DRAFT_1435741 [Cyathus striatus]
MDCNYSFVHLDSTSAKSRIKSTWCARYRKSAPKGISTQLHADALRHAKQGENEPIRAHESSWAAGDQMLPYARSRKLRSQASELAGALRNVFRSARGRVLDIDSEDVDMVHFSDVIENWSQEPIEVDPNDDMNADHVAMELFPLSAHSFVSQAQLAYGSSWLSSSSNSSYPTLLSVVNNGVPAGFIAGNPAYLYDPLAFASISLSSCFKQPVQPTFLNMSCSEHQSSTSYLPIDSSLNPLQLSIDFEHPIQPTFLNISCSEHQFSTSYLPIESSRVLFQHPIAQNDTNFQFYNATLPTFEYQDARASLPLFKTGSIALLSELEHHQLSTNQESPAPLPLQLFQNSDPLPNLFNMRHYNSENCPSDIPPVPPLKVMPVPNYDTWFDVDTRDWRVRRKLSTRPKSKSVAISTLPIFSRIPSTTSNPLTPSAMDATSSFEMSTVSSTLVGVCETELPLRGVKRFRDDNNNFVHSDRPLKRRKYEHICYSFNEEVSLPPHSLLCSTSPIISCYTSQESDISEKQDYLSKSASISPLQCYSSGTQHCSESPLSPSTTLVGSPALEPAMLHKLEIIYEQVSESLLDSITPISMSPGFCLKPIDITCQDAPAHSNSMSYEEKERSSEKTTKLHQFEGQKNGDPQIPGAFPGLAIETPCQPYITSKSLVGALKNLIFFWL